MGKHRNTPEHEEEQTQAPSKSVAGFLSRSDEKRIIGRIQKGEEEAFEELVEAYKQKAYYVALGFTNKNKEDALDLSQDAFVKAFKAIRTFNINEPFFPWFYKILRNHCLNYIKKNQRFRKESLDELQEENHTQTRDEKQPTPDERAQADDVSAILWQAIETLKPDFREIITLKHFHNLSYQEIAQALGIPIGTVMSRLYNARQELKDKVKSMGINRSV